MTRRTLIFFVSLVVCFEIGSLLILWYFSGLSPDGDDIQVRVLSSLIMADVLYVFYRLYNMMEDAAVVFIVIFAVATPIAQFVYGRFFRDLDPRIEFLQILSVLLITTVVVLLVARRRTRNNEQLKLTMVDSSSHLRSPSVR